MPDFVTVKITGLSEIQKKLEQMPEKVAKRAIRSALKRAAGIVRQKIVDMAPRKTGFLSGHFDIKIRQFRGFLAAVAHIGPNSKIYYPPNPRAGKRGGKRKSMPVIAVAQFHEFGTSRMPAHPFMRPAFTATREQMIEAISEELRKAVEEAAR